MARQSTTPLQFILKLLGYAVLIIIALTMVIPFIWMVTTSLKEPNATFAYPPQLLPTEINFANYELLFTRVPFGRYFLNTLLVTGLTVLGQVIVCSLAAYGFARLQFIGRDTLFVIYLATMMVPYQVTLIPLFLIVFNFGWVNTYQGLVIPAISSVFGIFLLRQAFQGVPRDYQEAARIDGASEFMIYWRIFLPLNGPALATLAVFAFMGTWTDLLWPLLIARSPEMRTLELGLAYFNSSTSAFRQTNWPLMMAASVVVMLPVLIVYMFAQRYFVRGITLSGVKG